MLAIYIDGKRCLILSYISFNAKRSALFIRRQQGSVLSEAVSGTQDQRWWVGNGFDDYRAC